MVARGRRGSRERAATPRDARPYNRSRGAGEADAPLP
jgi:hypothetical protein